MFTSNVKIFFVQTCGVFSWFDMHDFFVVSEADCFFYFQTWKCLWVQCPGIPRPAPPSPASTVRLCWPSRGCRPCAMQTTCQTNTGFFFNRFIYNSTRFTGLFIRIWWISGSFRSRIRVRWKLIRILNTPISCPSLIPVFVFCLDEN